MLHKQVTKGKIDKGVTDGCESNSALLGCKQSDFSAIFLSVSRIYLPNNIGHFIEKLAGLEQINSTQSRRNKS